MSEILRLSKSPANSEAEASSTASSALIPLIVRNARDLIAFLDVEGRRIYNSPSYAPLLGDPDMLAGTDSFADIHAEDRERVRTVFRDTVRNGSGYRVEYRLVACDGTARVIQSEGSVIRADGGRVVGVVVVGRDVTDERHSKSQLDAALRRQTALADFSLYALRASDQAHVIERAARLAAEALNVDFCTVLELEPDGSTLRVVAGHNWPQQRIGVRLRADEDVQARQALERYRQSGSKAIEAPPPVVTYDLQGDARFADSFRVREMGIVSAVCVAIPAAEQPYGTLSAHSRTQRRFDPIETEFMQAIANVLSAALVNFKSQVALADSESRFRSLADLSSDWYWEQDAELRFSSISDSYFDKSGMALEELLGKQRWDLSGAVPPEGSWDAHRAVLEARQPFRDFEFKRVTEDGTTNYQSISGEPVFDADGRFTGYRGTGRDLTARRRAEQELRARVEGDRALSDLGLIGLREQDAAVLLQSMVEIVARTLGTDLAAAGELQPGDTALKLVAGVGWEPGLVGKATVGADLESQAGYAIHQYQKAKQSGNEQFAPVIVADMSSERRFRVPAVMRENGVVSGMSVVIPGAERPWGVLGVHSRTPRRFEPREAEFLQAAANMLSAALARCAAHAASQESERRYRVLFEASPEPMFVFDRASLAILAVNRRMVEQYGWTREELLAMSILELRPPEERAQIVEDVRTTLGTRGWKRRRYWRKGGEVLDIEVTARFVNYGGRAAEMVIAVDVSQRLRMEQALREHRRLLARAQELAGLGYWQYDATSGVTGSRELRRILGIGRDVPVQSPEWCLNLVHPEDRERVRETVLEAFEKASSYELEARVLTTEGAQRILLIAGEALKNDTGRVTKLIGSCLDVTEQRERENALSEAADQLQALSRRLVDAQETERRRLATELHDRVGQNLTALGINLDMLARRMSGLDADARHRLEESHSLIVATTRCVAGVLDDLHPPMLDDLGLGPTLRWAAQDFSRRTEIQTKVRVDGLERRIDRQNELALLRIVQEALTNVARHAGECAVGITVVWHPEALQVEVADDGAGFECSGPRGATGLGIATMRERSLAVHGQLDIDSAPGRGTRVRVVVPG